MRKYPLSLLKDKNIVTFFDFWGKTRRGEKDGGDDYHLLCWHSLDVAAMGYLMVKRNCFGLADYFRQLGISDKEQAAQFFAWLLCWHDIGKFARSFQQLYLPPELKIQEGARKNYEKISHSTLGYWLWNHYLSECQELLPSSSLSPRKLRRVIEMWMPVTTGHHGRPPDRMDELDNFLPEDKAAARDFLLEIKPLFPLIEIPAFWDDDEGIELIKHLSWYISATVVLADWTGSSTRFFPRVAHPMDIKGYWQKTLIQAQNALTVFPLKAKVAPFNGINTLFPFIENPTPLQQKVLDLDISQQGPQLFILEDVTGAGKTEAALILAHRLIAAGKAQGLFFGLPTMATANAMYDRLVKTWLAFYSPESRPSLVLAHSARTLMDRFNESLWSGDLVGSEEPDEQTFSQGCAAWFADSNKKALLAEIGVGTLDQAMMAVMPFKHNNLRLLGLSNKILLADEIHACDAYMSCILEGLIERQARGGNSVILLSATLSQQQRDKLVAAFARGTEGQQEAPFLEKDDYPWLTHVTKSDVNSHRVATRKDVERSVSVGWLHSEQECIARIESAVSQGKCIAWIRNSVDDAIKVHRQLLARGVIPASSLSLFHSRFAFSDRQRIETETLARFGKYCSLQRASQVIVCTQVIEQSVDIDLDEMISDLAPVDLLIQRAGRLQRHIRDINGQLLVWVGEAGVRVYSSGQPGGARADKLLYQAKLALTEDLRLKVVRKMYELRFREPPPARRSVEQLRGIEGSRVRQTYALLAKQYGVKWNGRKYDPKDWEKGDVVNRCISAATSCLYGISEAAVLAAGYAPAIGFIHSGKPLSFVYDIADIIKFDLVVPKAFEIAARQPAEPDKEVRLACRDIFRSSKLTGKLIPLIEEVLAAGEIEPPQPAPDMLPPAIPEPETLGDSGHRGRGG
ncbi:TPA: type I-E CRISPR-associated endonuclease Cas1 [Escherichia coli]|nr:type I-E CRISPR-associated endonuclease Cas1 [Escherichia coli]